MPTSVWDSLSPEPTNVQKVTDYFEYVEARVREVVKGVSVILW